MLAPSRFRRAFASAPGLLCLLAASPAWAAGAPLNDAFASAEVLLPDGGTIFGTNEGATGEVGEPIHAGKEGGVSLWYRFAPPKDGRYAFTTGGSGFDTLLAVYSGDALDKLQELGSNNDSGDQTSAVELDLLGGAEVFIAVDGAFGSTGPLVLTWGPAGGPGRPANDDFFATTPLFGDAGEVAVQTLGATHEPLEPDHAGSGGAASVWFWWAPSADGPFRFETDVADFDSVLAVYEGDSLDALTLVAADDAPGSLTATVEFEASAQRIYRLVVDGAAGSAGNLALRWAPAGALRPANDDHARARTIDATDGWLQGTSANATLEPGEDSGGAGATVWFQWMAPFSGEVAFTTAGSAFDTILGIVAGRDAYFDDDGGIDGSSVVRLAVFGGVTYDIVLGGAGGASGDYVLEWHMSSTPPENDDFANATPLDAAAGDLVVSNFFATEEPGEPDHGGEKGGASIWYRFTGKGGRVTFDTHADDFGTSLGVYVGDKVDALLEIGSQTGGDPRVSFIAEDGVEYHLAIDSVAGRMDARISLQWAPPPANDDFAGAQLIVGPTGTVEGTNVGATAEPGEPGPEGPAVASIWYRWVAPADGAVQFSVVAPRTMSLTAYTGDALGDLVQVASGLGLLPFSAEAGVQYFFGIDGLQGGTDPLTLLWTDVAPPDNDDFANAEFIGGELGSVAGTTVGATAEPGEPVHHGRSAGASIWYRWTAPKDGRYTFTTRDSSPSTVLAVYTGDKLDALTEIASDAERYAGTAERSRVTFFAWGGVEYLVAVDGFALLDRAAIDLRWSPAPENDVFDAATVLAGEQGAVAGTLFGAGRDPGEPEARFQCSATVWYRFTAPRAGAYRFNDRGSARTTGLTAFVGDDLGNLEVVAQDGGADFALGRLAVAWLTLVAGAAGDEFLIAVSNLRTFPLGGVACDIDDDFALNWTFVPPPPNDQFADAAEIVGPSGFIFVEDEGATHEDGESAHAGDPGGGSVWFRWTAPSTGRFTFDVLTFLARRHLLAIYTGDGLADLKPVERAREIALLFSDEDPEVARRGFVSFEAVEGTRYWLALDGGNTTAFSARNGMYLSWDPAPLNDDRAAATEIAAASGTLDATLYGAAVEPDEYFDHASIWYRFVAPHDGRFRFHAAPDVFDPEIALFRPEESWPFAIGGFGGEDPDVDAVAGEVIDVGVGGHIIACYGGCLTFIGFGGASGSPVTLEWHPVPTNDDFAAAAPIGGVPGDVTGFTSGAGREFGEPNHGGVPGEASVWYRFTAPRDGVVRFSVEADFDAILAGYTGDAVDGLKSVEDAERGFGPPGSVSFYALAGQTYMIAVDGRGAASGSFTLRWVRPLPFVGVGDVHPATEGELAMSGAAFTMSLSFPADEPVRVDYRATSLSATAGADFAASAGFVIFDVGQTDAVVFVTVVDDALNEDTELFALAIDPPAGAAVERGEGFATVLDDDPLPALSIADAVARPKSTMNFAVRLAVPSGRTVRVVARTEDLTALSSRDYVATSATLEFAPGQTVRTFSVPLTKKARDGKRFAVRLSAPESAVLADAEAIGRILDE